MTDAPAYRAIAYQMPCPAVNRLPDRASARARMSETLDGLQAKLRGAKGFIGPDVRLVVLPEYFLTGFPLGDPIPVWADKAALEIDGPEYERLGRIAQDLGIFLAGNAYEQDPHFPNSYFQTSFVVDDSGSVVLRYRRLISMFAPSPYDVLDLYLEHYGADALFPVADTAIGRLACIASEEILYPEIARIHALKGAEVLLHSSSEALYDGGKTQKDIAKQARAMENLCWLVSANSAGITDTDLPIHGTDGMSKIVDHRGHVVIAAGQGETATAEAEIDLAASRRYRRRPGMPNLLARQPIGLYAAAYAGAGIHPANTMVQDGAFTIPERALFVERQKKVIAALAERGAI